MKKALLLVLVCVACVLAVGCKSTAPVFYYFSDATDYTILGEVIYSSTDAVASLASGSGLSTNMLSSGAGFVGLLAAAKAKYPDCDYVIDVMVDATVTNYFVISTSVYTLRGTAIKYK